MRGGFVENDEVASLHRDVIHDLTIRCPLGDVARDGIVRLMAAGDDAESAVARVDVGELILAVDQATPHTAILIRVEAGAVEVDGAVTVQGEAFRPLLRGIDEEVVIELPATAEEGVEIRVRNK